MRPLGGPVACSPRTFLDSALDSDLILGGGGTQAGGGKSQCAPPLHATLIVDQLVCSLAGSGSHSTTHVDVQCPLLES